MFSFVWNCQTAFQNGCTILHSYQQWMRVPVAPHPLQCLVLSLLLEFGHSSRCVVVSHCLNMQFSNDKWCRASFLMLICHLYVFGEVPVQISCPYCNCFFFPLLLIFESSFCILDISPLSDMCFPHAFYLFVLFSNFLKSIFCRARVLNFNEVQLTTFSHSWTGLLVCCFL